MATDKLMIEIERLRNDLARCREVQRATAEGWRHEVAEVASIVGAPPHTAELAACVRAEVERLRAERDHERTVANEQLARAHDAVRERDEARAEVERQTMTPQSERQWRELLALSEKAHTMNEERGTEYRVSAGIVSDALRDLLAEVERLRARVRSVDHSTAYEGKAFSDEYSAGDE